MIFIIGIFSCDLGDNIAEVNKGGYIMAQKSLSETPVANIDQKELKEIKELENKLNDKYYLIAFSK